MKSKQAGSKAKHWSARIEAFERSGLGRRVWCEQEGVSPNTLDYWRRRLRGARAGSTQARLVPIRMALASSLTLEVTLPGGALLRVAGVGPADIVALARGLSC